MGVFYNAWGAITPNDIWTLAPVRVLTAAPVLPASGVIPLNFGGIYVFPWNGMIHLYEVTPAAAVTFEIWDGVVWTPAFVLVGAASQLSVVVGNGVTRIRRTAGVGLFNTRYAGWVYL